ncbi:hypothetical protein D3C80_1791150 [compost metagenome]
MKGKRTGHLRHPAGPLPEERRSFQLIPAEFTLCLAGEQERTVPLGKLGKIDHRIIRSLLGYIN